MITQKKEKGDSQVSFIFIVSETSEEFTNKLCSLQKSVEKEDAWITILVMCNDLDVGSEVMLDLFNYCANEVNTMIFPVVDYFEIKDWLFNHIKTNSSEVFEQLKGLRNEILLSSIKECREEFTKHLSNKKANKDFKEDFIENPGLCVQTYFPEQVGSKNLHSKEDFTYLLDQLFDIDI